MAAAIAVAAAAPAAGEGQVRFVDVAAAMGVELVNVAGAAAKEYIVQSTGNGAAWLDYDGDGDLDLLLTHGSTLERMASAADLLLALYRNDGERFVDAGAAAGLDDSGWANGVCFADWDGDGDDDVYVTAHGANRFYVNDGRGRFDERAAELGVADRRWSTSCAWADYDLDGHLDLYVANYLRFEREQIPPRGCNYMGHASFCGPLGLPGEPDALYRNVEGQAFEEVTEASGLAARGRYGMAVAFVDVDGDRWPDLFVANDSQPNYFFRNRGDGTFVESGLLSGLAVSGRAEAQAAMGIAIGDTDRDGDLDLFITNFSQDHNTLYRNDGGAVFADTTFLAGVGGESIPYLAWGTLFADLDNDGALDLFVANGHIYEDVAGFGIGSTYDEPNQLFVNRGDGRFEEATAAAGPGFETERSSRGAAAGDFDGDGDLDLAVVNMAAAPSLLRNDSPPAGWLRLRLIGRRSAADPVGTVATVTGPRPAPTAVLLGGDSYQSASERRVHFGLGVDHPAPTAVELRWPSGARQRLVDPTPSRLMVVVEPAPPERD